MTIAFIVAFSRAMGLSSQALKSTSCLVEVFGVLPGELGVFGHERGVAVGPVAGGAHGGGDFLRVSGVDGFGGVDQAGSGERGEHDGTLDHGNPRRDG